MRLLIIGSLSNQIGAASRIAVARGASVLHADDPAAGLDVLRAGKGADVVMIDVRLDIVGFMQALEAERIGVPVVACGTETDAKAAVRAIQAGAKEYIPLPPDAELIAAVLEAIAEESHALLYADPRMERLVKLAAQVAPSEASILITGESGTGKEVIARFLHQKSRRASQRFVAVNCAAIPENLLESELFGYEKGAFTGAVARRIGRFEEASGGTLLLDEISEMDIRLQAKLLRAIQEKEIDRLGGTKPVKIDTRIVATSNRDLKAEVKAGRFREDLFFRLNVLNLALPALRDRKADIPLLARHFVKKYAEANGVPERPLTQEAKEALLRHSWPGNVRELENTLHRAVLLATGDEIGTDAIMLLDADGDAPAAEGGTGSLVGRTVADVERDLIIDTLKHTVGNRTHAANILGISIRTLRNKLRQYVEEGHAVPAPGEGEAQGL
ncbi:Transcriptional regulatory protein FlbD [uncultured Alphaproteobacteria bacterium]|uniref:Transcriptional regulatory protein FlbD n=1 Tax=uncultured Alphaproteobacteria bacterium TaxID=91750 RepID=A0A212JQ72_9PROT|nr:Transcriptional regulatory protein FlbD [uncultured Alphaproteobacteria bacterium]